MKRDSARVLRVCRDEIIESWKQLVQGAPWSHIPETARVDGLAPTLDAIADAIGAGVVRSPDGRRAIARPAAEHGMERARQRVEIDVLPTEYGVLRIAAWSTVQPRLDADERLALFVDLDYALSVATWASMAGHAAGRTGKYDALPAVLDRVSAGL